MLENLFGWLSGLKSLFTVPNFLGMLGALGQGLNLYSSLNSVLNPPKLPELDRLDRMGNQPMPQLPRVSAQDKARQFASARKQLAERGVYSGGAFEDPLASAPWSFGPPETMYALLDKGQALPSANPYDDTEWGI